MVCYTSYLCDLSVSMLYLAIGRLLPTLRRPRKNLTGKVALITGANSGIGLQIAIDLASLGATVYLACRNASKAEEAVKHITDIVPNSESRIHALSLNTSSLGSVRQLASIWSKGYPPIDILIHNAGIASVPSDTPTFTVDGFELTYATNFLGSFLLTYLLEKHLSPAVRVIFTSSTGQYAGRFSSRFSTESVTNRLEPGFHIAGVSKPFRDAVVAPPKSANSSAYSQSKLMQVAFARLLQKRFDYLSASNKESSSKRTAHAFTPGFTYTPIFGKVSVKSLSDVLKSPLFVILKLATFLSVDVKQGAATGVWLTTTDDAAVVQKGGEYWDRCVRKMSAVDLMKEKILEMLWMRWEADAGIRWRT